MSRMTFTLGSPAHGVLYEGPADSIRMATDVGSVEILPGHASLVGLSRSTPIVMVNGDHEIIFFAQDATLAVDRTPDGVTRVTVAALIADRKDEFDIESLKQFHEKMHAALQNHEDLSKYQVEFLQEHLDSVHATIHLHDGKVH